MTQNYLWTDNPTEANVAVYDPDILNDCLMNLKYSSPKFTPWCINSASLNASGVPDLLSYTGNTVKFNCFNSIVPSMSSNSSSGWTISSSHQINSSSNDLYKSFDGDNLSYCSLQCLPSAENPSYLTLEKTTSFSFDYLYLKFNTVSAPGSVQSFYIKNASNQVVYSYDNFGFPLDKDEFLIPVYGFSSTKLTMVVTSNVNNVNYVNFPSTIKLLSKSQVVSLSDYKGANKILAKINDLNISGSVSQTQNIYLGMDGSVESFASSLTKGNILPTTPVNNQVHYLTNTENCIPMKYSNSKWDVYEKIPVGYLKTNSSGNIYEVGTFLYNQNGYNINVNTLGALTKCWTSGEYTPVNNTVTICNHNLGIDPLLAKGEVLLKCINPEAGYSSGDIISSFSTPAYWNGQGICPPPTVLLGTNSIQTSMGTYTNTQYTLVAQHKSTNAAAVLTLANWRYVFRIFYAGGNA